MLVACLRASAWQLRLPALDSAARGLAYSTSSPGGRVKPFREMPGPRPLPILGNLLEVKRNLPKLAMYYHQCLKEFGGIFKLHLPGGGYTVVVADRGAIERMLQLEQKSIPSRFSAADAAVSWILQKKNLADILYFTNGERWRKLRSALDGTSTREYAQSCIPAINDIYQHFITYLRRSRDKDGFIEDIDHPLKMLLVEVSAMLVYGARLSVVEHPSQESKSLVQAIHTMNDSTLKLFTDLPLYRVYPTKAYREFSGALSVAISISNKYLAAAHQESVPGGERGGALRGAAMPILRQWLEDGQLTVEEVAMHCVEMFVSGIDTTSHAATFMLHELAKYPKVQERLHKEVVSVLGKTGVPSAEDMESLPYVTACMREALRLYPTDPFVSRFIEDGTTLMGYQIPPNTTVIYSTYSAGRDEAIFANAETFIPERWIEEKQQSPSQPFGFGQRSCYGRYLGELQMKLLLIQMTQNFRLKTKLRSVPIVQQLVLRPAVKVPLQLCEV